MLVKPALELARRRHAALSNDDMDAYTAADSEMSEHCARLLAQDAGALSTSDRADLDELLALEMASARMLAMLSNDVSARLAMLAAKSRTNTAYLRAERSSVNPL